MNTFPAFLHIPLACILETLPAVLRIRQQAIQYSPSNRQHSKVDFIFPTKGQDGSIAKVSEKPILEE